MVFRSLIDPNISHFSLTRRNKTICNSNRLYQVEYCVARYNLLNSGLRVSNDSNGKKRIQLNHEFEEEGGIRECEKLNKILKR